jgi:hypothetical protein
MKILIDMNLSPDWTTVFKGAGFEALRWPDEQKPYEGHTLDKGGQHPESPIPVLKALCVDAAGISVKVSAHYPGRSVYQLIE